MEYSQLLSELRQVESNEPCIIAIDGAAGSGKTTLAQKLLEDLSDVQVIHMDDLYDELERSPFTKISGKSYLANISTIYDAASG